MKKNLIYMTLFSVILFLSCAGESNKEEKQDLTKKDSISEEKQKDTVFNVKACQNWSDYKPLISLKSIKFKISNGFSHDCMLQPRVEKWQNGKLIDSDDFSVPIKMNSSADLTFHYSCNNDPCAMNVRVENEAGGTVEAKVEIQLNEADDLYIDAINEVSALTPDHELLIAVIAPENEIKAWPETDSIANGLRLKINLLKE